MFSRFFITSSKYQVGVLSNSGDRPGWKTGSSLAFFVLLYGHFTIFHSLNMIEVGQLKMLQCDVLVFLLWCFFLRRGFALLFLGKLAKRNPQNLGATSSRLPGSLLKAFC